MWAVSHLPPVHREKNHLFLLPVPTTDLVISWIYFPHRHADVNNRAHNVNWVVNIQCFVFFLIYEMTHRNQYIQFYYLLFKSLPVRKYYCSFHFNSIILCLEFIPSHLEITLHYFVLRLTLYPAYDWTIGKTLEKVEIFAFSS